MAIHAALWIAMPNKRHWDRNDGDMTEIADCFRCMSNAICDKDNQNLGPKMPDSKSGVEAEV